MDDRADGVLRSFGGLVLMAFAAILGGCEREEYVGVGLRNGRVVFEQCGDRHCVEPLRWYASRYAVEEHDRGQRVVWTFSPRDRVRQIRFGDPAYGDTDPLVPSLTPGPVYVVGRCSFRVLDDGVERDVTFGSRCAPLGRDG